MNSEKNKHYDIVFKTDIALIGLQFEGLKLMQLDYLKNEKIRVASSRAVNSVKNKIENYLADKTRILKVDMTLNVTPFQKKVLEQLQKIPYGETRTYGEIAKTLKTSPRAVGNACRNNPVPIVIPCHRVVSATGIGGYDGARSGSLLDIKRKLLQKEGVFL